MIIVINVLITFRITQLIKMRNYKQVTEQRFVSCAAMETNSVPVPINSGATVEAPVCTVIEDCMRGVGWELRWGAGEEKVKGKAKMKEREFEGEDSVHEAMDTLHTCMHAPRTLHTLTTPPHSLMSRHIWSE